MSQELADAMGLEMLPSSGVRGGSGAEENETKRSPQALVPAVSQHHTERNASITSRQVLQSSAHGQMWRSARRFLNFLNPGCEVPNSGNVKSAQSLVTALELPRVLPEPEKSHTTCSMKTMPQRDTVAGEAAVRS